MYENKAVAVSVAPDLPTPLPPVDSRESEALTAFRKAPTEDSAFRRLRRQLREAEDWRGLATLLVVYAAGQKRAPAERVYEMYMQAVELWIDRVGDLEQAANTMARAFKLNPGSAELYNRLKKLYGEAGLATPHATLLRWQIELQKDRPEVVSELLVELGQVGEHGFMNVSGALTLYRKALALNPRSRSASANVIRLHIQAGAWLQASDLINAEISRLNPAADADRVAELHLQLARIEHEQMDNVPAAARYLQTALKTKPNSVAALRAFGILYQGSDKASEDGLAKAADIFLKAATLAHQQGDDREALKLVRRSLSLRPDHHAAGQLLADLLIAQKRWLDLDDLYRSWLEYVSDKEAYDLWFQRGDLLETKLSRREEARMCFETASQYESLDGPAWQRLEKLYSDLGDDHALVGLYSAQAEHLGANFPTDKLLRAARVYRENLNDDARAAEFFYKVLERDPFNPEAFEGYKEHWRRKNAWIHLRDLILYQISQAFEYEGNNNPLRRPEFVEEFVEAAEISEKRLGDLDTAREIWSQVSECYPTDPRPREHIPRLDKRARQWAQQERTTLAELGRTESPQRRVNLLRRLAKLYREHLTDAEQAMAVYEELLDLKPDDATSLEGVTELYERTGSHEALMELLRRELDDCRAPGKRMALLRRMAELWQHDLDDPDNAIWACEQLLTFNEQDLEAIHRLQTLYSDTHRDRELYACLERELKSTKKARPRLRLLRRMANVAEHRLQDMQRAADVWEQLLEHDPYNLEVLDKMIAVYEQSGRFNELVNLLNKATASKKTPPQRQFDYLLRLAYHAENSLNDLDLACSAIERALRINRNHRGAVWTLVRLYRDIGSGHGLAASLGTLQELVDTEEEALSVGWERAEVLADKLGNVAAAIKVLEQLSQEVFPGHRDLNLKLLELYERGEQHRKRIHLAEVLLLSAHDIDERRELFMLIARTWIAHLGDAKAATTAFARFMAEYENDAEGIRFQAELQELSGDTVGTIALLEEQLSKLDDTDEQIRTLEHMADVCERNGDPRQGLRLLGKAYGRVPQSDRLQKEMHAYAGRHELWSDLVGIYGEVYANTRSDKAKVGTQLHACRRASEIAETDLGDPSMAFSWARKTYFIAREHKRPTAEALDRLEALAEKHDLWNGLLGVFEEELTALQRAPKLDTYSAVKLLQTASDIAFTNISDPQRGISYLQRAYAISPDDEELAHAIEKAAREHELYKPLIDLHERKLNQTTSALSRFEICIDIVRIYEKNLNDPKAAVERLRKAWLDLRDTDKSLAEEALDMLTALAEKHELWGTLADHHRDFAKDLFKQGNTELGCQNLLSAAAIYEERDGDKLAAFRSLRDGLAHDPGGKQLLPELERIADDLDSQEDDASTKVGGLILLTALQRLITATKKRSAKAELLARRAEIREQRLDDKLGALAEWVRVLAVDATHEQAADELHRLANETSRMEVLLLNPGAELQRVRARSSDENFTEKARLYNELAEIYEQHLDRAELAMRAKIGAFLCAPALPEADPEQPVAAIHSDLWRLAKAVGNYQTPPLPKDPHLTPKLVAPELRDTELWEAAGLNPMTLERVAPAKGEQAPADDDPQNNADTSVLEVEEVSVVQTEGNGPAPIPGLQVSDKTTVVDLADLEMMMVDGPPAPDKTTVVDLADLEMLNAAMAPPPKKPPPPKAPPKPPPAGLGSPAGLPAIPQIKSSLLPARPQVASAFAEVAEAYRKNRPNRKKDRFEVSLALARMWDEGAEDVEHAFTAYEQALLLRPDHEPALAGLESLAARHDARARQLKAYKRLIAEVTLPENLVRFHLLAGKLQEQLEAFEQAIDHNRRVLGMNPQNREALEALARLYAAIGDDAQSIDASSRLLDIERKQLSPEEQVERTLQVARDLANRVGRVDAALRKLKPLLGQHPYHAALHRCAIEFLTQQERHRDAAALLSVAVDRIEEPDFVLEGLQTLANIYSQHLKLPDRAIATWEKFLELEPDDANALSQLCQLYLEAGRHEPLLPLIDTRLDALSPDARDERLPLLLLKAKTLAATDEADKAIALLEPWVGPTLDRDDVLLTLVDLQCANNQVKRGMNLLETRLRLLSNRDDSAERSRALALSLADLHVRHHDDPAAALEIIAQTIDSVGASPELLARRARLAEVTGNHELQIASLIAVDTPEALLQAAELSREAPGRAQELVESVLERLPDHPTEPQARDLFVRATAIRYAHMLTPESLDEAAAFLDQQLEGVDENQLQAQLLTESGRRLLAANEPDRAYNRLNQALELDPDHAAARLTLGELYLQAEQFENAEKELEGAMEVFGLNRNTKQLIACMVLLAQVLEKTDRKADAHRHLAAALRQDPQNLSIQAAVARNRAGAGRWRDALATITNACEQHPEPADIERRDANILAELLVLAATCERKLKHEDNVVTRYQQALRYDPHNGEALRALIELCREHGLLEEAARHCVALAEGASDAKASGHAWIEAGLNYLAAARELEQQEHEHDEDSGEKPEPGGEQSPEVTELLTASFDGFKHGLRALAEVEDPGLQLRTWETMFWASSQHEADIALHCLPHLAEHDDLEPKNRLAILIEGIGAALRRDLPDDIEFAEAYARAACEAFPDSSIAVSTLCDVLAAQMRYEEIEPLVLEFFNRQGLRSQDPDPDEVASRSALLRRLAESQGSHPDRVIGLLERAEELDAGGLGLPERKHLARLYLMSGRTDERVANNYEALVKLDPTDDEILTDYAALKRDAGDLDHAHALYSLLLHLNPSHIDAREFLQAHTLTCPEPGKVDIQTVVDPPPPNGGMVEALTLLWKGGAALICKQLPRIDASSDAIVPDDGDTLLARSWVSVRDQLSAPRFPLVRASVLGKKLDNDGQINLAQTRCQYPPIILAAGQAETTEDAGQLRFALGRALYFARPATVLGATLPKTALARVISATLQAFHPRHEARKSIELPTDAADQATAQAVNELSEALGRALPKKITEQLRNLFTTHQDEVFDSREWKAWLRHSGNRAGLCLAGELNGPLRSFGFDGESTHGGRQLRATALNDPALRDLLAFAGSRDYVEARQALGFRVVATAS